MQKPLPRSLSVTVAVVLGVLTTGCFGSDSLRGHDLGLYKDHPSDDDGGPEADTGEPDQQPDQVAPPDGPPVDQTGDAGPVDLGPPPAGMPTGSVCSQNLACQGGLCIPGQNGYPGGYCSATCNAAGDCGDGAACLPVPGVGSFCVATCDDDGGCRDGYLCLASWFGSSTAEGQSFCAPGNRDARLGDACQDLSTCAPDDFCLTEAQGAPGGYCSRTCNPGQPGSCGDGGDCVRSGQTGFCAAACTGGSDCRPGYACAEGFLGFESQGRVCSPGVDGPVAIGAGCDSSSDCAAGTQLCAAPASGFDGGYCTQGCDPRASASCGAGATCLGFDPQNPGSGFCFAACDDGEDCQALRGDADGSYGCSDRSFGQPNPGGASVCLPFDPTADVGDACVTLGDCTLGAFCVPDDGGNAGGPRFQGGYCSDSCNPQVADSCGEGNNCVNFDSSQPTTGACLQACNFDTDCRLSEGYGCVRVGTGGGCFPGF